MTAANDYRNSTKIVSYDVHNAQLIEKYCDKLMFFINPTVDKVIPSQRWHIYKKN